MGLSPRKFQSSVESLLRRNYRGVKPPKINPLVDFYNAVSLRHLVPAGAFDVSDIRSDIELRLTRKGDLFTPLDGDRPVEVHAGEVAYATGSAILTRHFVWKQARQALVTPETTSLVLVAEILQSIGSSVVEAVEADFIHGLTEMFHVRPNVSRLTESRAI